MSIRVCQERVPAWGRNGRDSLLLRPRHEWVWSRAEAAAGSPGTSAWGWRITLVPPNSRIVAPSWRRLLGVLQRPGHCPHRAVSWWPQWQAAWVSFKASSLVPSGRARGHHSSPRTSCPLHGEALAWLRGTTRLVGAEGLVDSGNRPQRRDGGESVLARRAPREDAAKREHARLEIPGGWQARGTPPMRAAGGDTATCLPASLRPLNTSLHSRLPLQPTTSRGDLAAALFLRSPAWAEAWEAAQLTGWKPFQAPSHPYLAVQTGRPALRPLTRLPSPRGGVPLPSPLPSPPDDGVPSVGATASRGCVPQQAHRMHCANTGALTSGQARWQLP